MAHVQKIMLLLLLTACSVPEPELPYFVTYEKYFGVPYKWVDENGIPEMWDTVWGIKQVALWKSDSTYFFSGLEFWQDSVTRNVEWNKIERNE